jgi:hypothetical protein
MSGMRWRKITWAIVLFSAVMLTWVLLTAPDLECLQHLPGSPDRAACDLGADVRSGLGRAAIVLLWLLGIGILGVVWLATKPPRRRCPACGKDVRTGLTVCPTCGHDFAAALERP